MAGISSGAVPASGWQRVAAANGLGNPDAAPASDNTITAQQNLPPPPPPADSSFATDVLMVVGLVAAVVLAILVRNSILKAQVAKMKPYDEAKNHALIAAIATFFVVAALAISVGQTVLKG